MVKVTFTLDNATVERLTREAARRRIPKSQVVREAIEDYSGKEVRLSDAERERKLAVIRKIIASPPTLPKF
jgi:predicted transcriptional regulator